MKDIRYICCQPDDNYFKWQVHLWIESLKDRGVSDKAVVLIFTPFYREKNASWQNIVSLYPEVEFKFYKDEENLVSKQLGVYIPVLRPFLLMKYFAEFPDMENKAIFYYDADVILTERFNIQHLIDDEICYLSDTKSYIGAEYFKSKIKDVLEEKKDEYIKTDVLQGLCDIIGVSKAIAEQNNNSSGGAQYLIKNVDYLFWKKVMYDCIKIRTYLQNVNKEYFKSENAGFQSWCADMWSILFNLWRVQKETKIVPEMDFAWSTDNINKLEKVGILHNAGIVSNMRGETPVFYKGNYHTGKDPFKDAHIYNVYENEESKKLCNWAYVNELIKLKNKYKINY